jgi:hypothetical protein
MPEMIDSSAGIRVALLEVKASVDALTQGLHLMVETQQTHTEMLEQILEAAAKPPPAESPLQILLADIVAALETQSSTLDQICGSLDHIAHDVEAAVVRGAQLVMDGVDLAEDQAGC